MRQNARDDGLVDLARGDGATFVIARLSRAGGRNRRSVHFRPGVEGNELGLVVDEGQLATPPRLSTPTGCACVD
jgi:hypothetical protein